MIIQNDLGEDIEVFTAEEAQERANMEASRVQLELEEKYKKEIEDKDNHYREKIDQFTQGKKSIDVKEQELELKISEADRIAKEALSRVEQAEKIKQETIKGSVISQLVGGNADLVKKVLEAYELINLPITNDTDIETRVKLAANMVGVTQISSPSISFSGGVSPTFKPADELSQQSHESWKKELGL